MTCREVIDFLMDYLDGELAETRRVVFEHHLSRCLACVAYLHNYQQTIQVEEGAFREPDEALESVPEELIQAILAARASQN